MSVAIVGESHVLVHHVACRCGGTCALGVRTVLPLRRSARNLDFIRLFEVRSQDINWSSKPQMQSRGRAGPFLFNLPRDQFAHIDEADKLTSWAHGGLLY